MDWIQVYEHQTCYYSMLLQIAVLQCQYNPWGGVYRVVIKLLRRQRLSQVTSQRIFFHLVFLPLKQPRDTMVQFNDCVAPPVLEKELQEICGRVRDNKSPDLDTIPKDARKLPVKNRPDRKCSPQWKKQKLVLFPKLKKPTGSPAPYPPIYVHLL